MIHIGSLKPNYLRICNRNDALLIVSAVKRPPISTLLIIQYVCCAYPKKGYICLNKTYSQTSAESSIPKAVARHPREREEVIMNFRQIIFVCVLTAKSLCASAAGDKSIDTAFARLVSHLLGSLDGDGSSVTVLSDAAGLEVMRGDVLGDKSVAVVQKIEIEPH